MRRQRQVDVFREPLDDAEHLRQRRAAFEHEAACELRLEQHAQKPADAEILLQTRKEAIHDIRAGKGATGRKRPEEGTG
jgi:hypothetical protein